jgi:hypothetical protein
MGATCGATPACAAAPRTRRSPRRWACAESISGDVRLELLAPPQSVQVDAARGEVDVIVPAGASYRVSAWTRSGERAMTVPVDPSSPRMITVDGGSGDVRLHTG